MIIFTKKLGSYLLVELAQDKISGDIILTLYKKWNKGSNYEATDYAYTFKSSEREKVIAIYDCIRLKNVYKEMELLK